MALERNGTRPIHLPEPRRDNGRNTRCGKSNESLSRHAYGHALSNCPKSGDMKKRNEFCLGSGHLQGPATIRFSCALRSNADRRGGQASCSGSLFGASLRTQRSRGDGRELSECAHMRRRARHLAAQAFLDTRERLALSCRDHHRPVGRFARGGRHRVPMEGRLRRSAQHQHRCCHADPIPQG